MLQEFVASMCDPLTIYSPARRYKNMHVVDLKKNIHFIEQYVELRNSYTDLLLTDRISVAGTTEWVGNPKNDPVEIRLLIENGLLSGAVLLYLDRNGEVAFFAKKKNNGVGSRLLEIIQQVAINRSYSSIWAWVRADNLIAQRVFEKNGYKRTGSDQRKYKNVEIKGFTFKKDI